MVDTLDCQPDLPPVGLSVENLLMRTPQSWLLDSWRLKFAVKVLHPLIFRSNWPFKQQRPITRALSWLLNKVASRPNYHEDYKLKLNADGTRTLVESQPTVVDGKWTLEDHELPVRVAQCLYTVRDATVVV